MNSTFAFMAAKDKTLIVGWDAADWQIIKPMIQAGQLPCLGQLLRQGTRANLATLHPPLSPLLWTSIATGQPAHRHGILGFVEKTVDGQSTQPVSSAQRQEPAFWNIFSEAGLRSLVVNWWPSSPPEPIEGRMVPDWFFKTASPSGDWAAALEAYAAFKVAPEELSLGHLRPFLPELSASEIQQDPLAQKIAGILARAASVHNVALELMEKEDWQVAAVYYEAIDHFSHLAMRYHPPQLPEIEREQFEKYQYVVRAAYRLHDMMLQALLDKAGPEVNLILLSDHGFQSGRRRSAQLPELPAAPALEHRNYGILFAKGPAFRAGHKIYGASLLDILPTLLHLHQLPLGEDMPGRPLQELFRQAKPASSIPSWRQALNFQKQDFSGPAPSAAVLRDLEELGYLDRDSGVAAIDWEWQYNRALSLQNSGLHQEALSLAESLSQQQPSLRIDTLRADLYLRLNRYQDFDRLTSQWDPAIQNHPYGIFLRGLKALQTGALAEALELFEQVEARDIRSRQLWLEMARTLYTVGRLEEALGYFEKVLQDDPEDPAALTGRAAVQLDQDRAAIALSDLERSVSLRFFQPQAHYLLALAFANQGETKAARQALRTCLQQAPKHQKARALAQRWQGNASADEETLVVTGLPRSGTSMMMKLLQQGGVALKVDAEREADQHNPQGYFEWSPVKKLPQEPGHFKDTAGQAVKVVAPLLRYLPADRPYRVIWMDRPLIEVILSQNRMKGEPLENFPFRLALDYEEEVKKIKQWLDQQPHIHWQSFAYRDFVNQPQQSVQALADFLQVKLNLAQAAEAIKPNLYRRKIE